MAEPSTRAVDERLPPERLTVLGVQHVLVMYAGAVAVPLIIAGALGLPPEQRTLLINADLFACGLATLVQACGFWGVGIRLPVMMGVTFAAVAPMLAMIGAGKSAHMTPTAILVQIYGAVIAAGVFAFLVAPWIGRLLRFFPAVVTGTIITVIGITLIRIGIDWAGGGSPIIKKPLDGVLADFPNPAYGQPDNMGIALLVLIAILLITKYAKGFLASIAVLLGIVFGAIVATLAGKMSFATVATAPWFAFVYPFQFGMPTFDGWSIVTMALVMIVVMVESTGMFLALGTMTGKNVDMGDLTRGLRADGVGTVLGGVFNTFPYTSFSQNVGLVGVTGVRSRWVAVAGGVMLLILGLMPKLAAVFAATPVCVLGGAGLVMFGMVAATGIRILASVNDNAKRHNLLIVAVGISFGMLTLVAPNFFARFPQGLKPLLDSGILLTTIVTVILNAYFNGAGSEAAGRAGVAAAASQASGGH
jgi:NCS2 family nucleobase:cation symporter-2